MTENGEHMGADALRRAEKLVKVRVDADRWETEYKDAATGETWILDYPHSEQHGGGSPRLKKQGA